MKFRTEIKPEISPTPILHNERILTIGSCFADNIAEKFKLYKFQVLQNSFGVLYNPVSIKQSLELLTGIRKFNKEDLFEHLNEWHSFYHHSIFSSENKNRTLEKIKQQIETASDFLRNADVIIITLGTAFVYKYKKLNLTVSNCHKIPAQEFEKKRLSVVEAGNEIESIIKLVRKVNSKIRFIFTVSPIRHWKEGAVDNQLSKSALLLGISGIIKNYDFCHYFPAYEIMMDDLRDYRFYNEDLLHPNRLAINYIWEKFLISEVDRSADQAINDFGKLYSAISHIPKDYSSESFKIFAENQLKFINELEKRYKYLDLKEEEYYFKEKKGLQS
jgi:hypothetical protein